MTPEQIAEHRVAEKLAARRGWVDAHARALALLAWPRHTLEPCEDRRGWSALVAHDGDERREVCVVLVLGTDISADKAKQLARNQVEHEFMQTIGPSYRLFFDSYALNEGRTAEEKDLLYAAWDKRAREALEDAVRRAAGALRSSGSGGAAAVG